MNSLVIILSLISTAAASRVAVNSLQKNQSTAGGSSWSPWELSYKGLSCLSLQAVPFLGLSDHWPKCWQKAIKAAGALAAEGNCKLCDVDFVGSKPEKMQSPTSTGCSAVVTCAAGRLGEKACYEGHGTTLAMTGLNDESERRKSHHEMACHPCPDGCKQCHVIESKITGINKKKFKCIVAPVGNAEVLAHEGGARCVTPSGLKCGACSKRVCSFYSYSCSSKDYKSDCEFPASYTNRPWQVDAPENYVLTVKSGEDKNAQPPVLEYLSGEKKVKEDE